MENAGGVCADTAGWLPVQSLDECDVAARNLQLNVTTVRNVTSSKQSTHVEGCILKLKDADTAGETVVFNPNPNLNDVASATQREINICRIDIASAVEPSPAPSPSTTTVSATTPSTTTTAADRREYTTTEAAVPAPELTTTAATTTPLCAWDYSSPCAWIGGECVHTVTYRNANNDGSCLYDDGVQQQKACKDASRCPATTTTTSAITTTSTAATSSIPSTDCTWHWGPFEECELVNDECKRHHHFIVDQEPTGSGNACPHADGDEQAELCDQSECAVDCVGTWAEWETCEWRSDSCEQHRHFEVVSQAVGSGASCAHEDDYEQWRSCTDTAGCPLTTASTSTESDLLSRVASSDDMDFFIAIIVLITAIVVIFGFSWVWKKLKPSSRAGGSPSGGHVSDQRHAHLHTRPATALHSVIPVHAADDDEWFSDDADADVDIQPSASLKGLSKAERKAAKKAAKKAKKAAKKLKKKKTSRTTTPGIAQNPRTKIVLQRDAGSTSNKSDGGSGLKATTYESVSRTNAPGVRQGSEELDSLDDDDFDAFQPDWGNADGEGFSSDELPSPGGVVRSGNSGGNQAVGQLSTSSIGIDAGLADDDMSFNVEW